MPESEAVLRPRQDPQSCDGLILQCVIEYDAGCVLHYHARWLMSSLLSGEEYAVPKEEEHQR